MRRVPPPLPLPEPPLKQDDHDPTPLRLIAPDEGANRARARRMSRRTFVVASSLTGAAAASLTGLQVAAAADPDPFTLGVASGDPSDDGVVLWTRLAVDPLAEDGHGGMPTRKITVEWQVASDEKFESVVRSGRAVADPAWGHSVHVEVDGLEADRWYHYRFRVGSHLSPVARTRTLPAADATTDLHAVAVSCSHYEGGWFTAYHHAAEERPDVVLELGDYIYEGAGNEDGTRTHPGSTCMSLADYRRRYALYHAEAETQELHHAAPWIVTWDDHEIQDNWAGIHPKEGVPTDEFERRRANAMRAYYENMPLRKQSRPSGVKFQLFRRFSWGRTADLHVLDTRQYRDLQACHDGGSTWWFTDCPERDDPDRTMLGTRQTDWLVEGLAKSEAQWQILPQGVFFSHRDGAPGPEEESLSVDGWDGYRANRNLIRDTWTEHGHLNTTVLTGDVHKAFANEILADFDDPGSPTVGIELVTTSVTSAGDGVANDPSLQPVLEENEHIKWIDNLRGYLSATWTRDGLTARFMTVPKVTTPGAPVNTEKVFHVPAGEPGLHEG